MADDDITWDAPAAAPKEDISWEAPAAGTTPEAADHGLSERQKLSPVGKALSPITGYWDTYQRMRNEAYQQAGRGLHQMANPDSLIDPQAHGISDELTGLANTAAGGFNYLLGSPVNAAYRSIVGQPVEDVTGIPREYSEFVAQLMTPKLGFPELPKAPGSIAEAMPKITPREGPDLQSLQAETNRELGREFGIDYTRGQATGDLDAIRNEDMSARGANGKEQQDLASSKFEDQFKQIQGGARNVGEQLSRGEQPLNQPADAGAVLNTEIGDKAAAARAERDKALQAAEQTRGQQTQQADQRLAQEREQTEQDAARQRQLADERAQAITEGVAGGHPMIENTRDAGELVGQGIRDAAAENRAEFRGLYNQFGQMEGTFDLQAVQGMGTRLRDDLNAGENPIAISDRLTPLASEALQKLDTMSSGPTIQNRAAPRMPMSADTTIAGVNLRGIDQMRRTLVSYYRGTERGSEDQRAMLAIMRSFDGQIEHAITQGLFSGDPRALDVLRAARESYSRYRQTFGPTRSGDDVGLAMQRIVDRHATPEEIANMVIGSGKLGNAGLPVRIANRLEEVLGADSPEFNSVRQAIWQKASQVRNAAGDVDALKSANSIRDFAGSTLAQRHFAPEELAAMRNHSEGLRTLTAAEKNMPVAQKAATAAHAEATKGAEAAFKEATARAHSTYESAFGGDEFTGPQRAVFRHIAEGTATPEETANAMFSVIGAGNPGNAVRALQGIEKIVGKDSSTMGAIRQGVWQKLTQHAFGKDQPGQQKLVQSINEFLNGNGRMVAKQLYSDDERKLMGRYAEAVRRTIIPKYARTNSDTAVAAAAHQQRKVTQIASTLASMLHGGPLTHVGGHMVARMINNRLAGAASAADTRALRESLHDVIPPQKKLPPPPGPPRTFKPVPIANAARALLGS